MKRMLPPLALTFCICLLFGLGSVLANRPTQTYDVHLIVAHDPAPAYYMQAMKHFAERVEQETDNHVRIQILTSRQYGNIESPTIREALISGKIEMSASTVSALGVLDKDLWALEMPYLFDNYAEVEQVIDGPVGQAMLERLTQHHLRALAFTYSGGFKVVCADRPIRKPSDFAGLAVLTRDPVNTALFTAMGARVVSGDYPQTKALMANGTIQASDMTLTRVHEYGLRPRYVNQLEHSFFLTTLVMNQAFYNNLPAAYQTVIRNAATDIAREERAATIHENERIARRLTAEGVHVTTLTPTEKARFRQATAGTYRQFNGYFTAGLLEQLQSPGMALAK